MTPSPRAPCPVVLVHPPAHCHLGWAGEADLPALVRALALRGWTPTVWRVADAADLARRLAGAPPALFWPNGYVIDDGHGARSLPALLAEAGRPLVGSGAAALALMLDKPRCQRALAAAGVPVPVHAVVEGPVDAEALRAAGLRPPVIVKPADLCGSVGIDGDAVCADLDEAASRAGRLAADFGRVMVEGFLPGADLTVAALWRDGRWQTTATWYRVADRPPDRCPLDRRSRLLPWGGVKRMAPVVDRGLLAQAAALAPRVCRAVGARGVTRFDTRPDAEGRLRVFDVNGMPALAWPDGVLVQQMLTARGHDFEVFADLVDDIARAAARRWPVGG